MDTEEEIIEVHLIPETEDEARHWRNAECWCEPKEGDREDFPSIKSVMDECDDDYIIILHNFTH